MKNNDTYNLLSSKTTARIQYQAVLCNYPINITRLGTMRTYDSLQGIATAFLLDRETE